MFRGLLQNAQIGGIHFILFFIFIISYSCLKTLTSFFDYLTSLKKAHLKELSSILFSALMVLVISLGFFALVSQSLEKINIAGIDAVVAKNNNTLMKVDHKIFGAYPPFWFESNTNSYRSFFSSWSCVFTVIYNSIAIVIAISLIFALIKGGFVFNKVLSVYVLTLLVGLIIWYLYPVSSPLDGYLDKKPEPIHNQEIVSAIENYEPSANTVVFFNVPREAKSGLGEKLWVTSIPSMHIVWTVIVAYSLFLVFRPLLVISIPYLILNSIATIITLQHYAVDVIAGILFGAIGILVVEKISYLKKIRLFDPLSNALKKDLNKFIKLFKLF